MIVCERAVTARTNPCTASTPTKTKGPRCTPSSKPNSPASSHVKKRKRLRHDLQQSHRAGSGSCQAASDGCAQGAGSSSEVPDGLEKPTPNLAYVATAGRRAKGCRRTVSPDPPPGWRSRTDRETQPRSAGAKPGVRLASTATCLLGGCPGRGQHNEGNGGRVTETPKAACKGGLRRVSHNRRSRFESCPRDQEILVEKLLSAGGSREFRSAFDLDVNLGHHRLVHVPRQSLVSSPA